MTKKVTQNVTNSNSEDLTELYQKGKLPKGYYYLKKPDGEVMIITPSLRFMVDGYSILAEVPSYEEWFNQGDYVAYLEEENTKLKEELQKKETQRIKLMTKLNDVNNENHSLRIENDKLKEQINKCCMDAINRGTANTVKAVKEFGMPERIKELVEQNIKLKELLKECRDEIEYLRKHYKGNIDHFKNNTRLDKEINQVLGEE